MNGYDEGMEKPEELTDVGMEIDEGDEKGLFWKDKGNYAELSDEVRENLDLAGVKEFDLDGMREIYQERVSETVNEMVDRYPELKNFVGKISMKDLPEGVFALTGPRMGSDGFYTEIQLNRTDFARMGLEYDLLCCETPNYKGESWLAGKGLEGIMEHEMAHLLHLRLISQELGIGPGDVDMDKFRELKEKYGNNDPVDMICQEAMDNLGIEKSQLGKELSLYATTDFGECFAEAISEHESSIDPRELSNEIYRLYKEKVEKEGLRL